jgi:CheY-like chemotaxis protein
MNPKKLFLAEDDLDDQHLFADFLNDRNDIILMNIAENGVDLFNSLESIANFEGLPDLIILDQNMPKRNGLQTLKLLKEDNRYTHIPVMVYSTYTDQDLIRNSVELGASIVSPKPISKEGYDKMIDDFLKVIN